MMQISTLDASLYLLLSVKFQKKTERAVKLRIAHYCLSILKICFLWPKEQKGNFMNGYWAKKLVEGEEMLPM